MRKKHPNKEIESAIAYAESMGWEVIARTGHAWGSLRCPSNNPDCRSGLFCQMSVWSTPKNPGGHARQLIQKVDGCTKQEGEQDE